MFEGKLHGTKVNLEEIEGTVQHCNTNKRTKQKLFKFKIERHGIHQALNYLMR